MNAKQPPWTPVTYDRRASRPHDGPKPGIRSPVAGDQGYIANSWLHQIADVDPAYVLGKNWGQAGKHVDLVLERPDTQALLVHEGNDVRRILSWVVYATTPGVPVIHFVHTRLNVRGRGFATELLKRAGVKTDTAFVYSCRAPDERVMLRSFRHATYHPLFKFLGLPSQYGQPAEKLKGLEPPKDGR